MLLAPATVILTLLWLPSVSTAVRSRFCGSRIAVGHGSTCPDEVYAPDLPPHHAASGSWKLTARIVEKD